MIEHNHLAILRLCDLLEQVRQSELRLTRITYRVAYLRKIRSAILTKRGTPDGFQKWKDNLKGLNEEIEHERAKLLDARHEHLEFKKKIRNRLNRYLKSADASIVFSDGKQIGIEIGRRDTFISVEKFREMADQYEAAVAMDEILNR